MHIRHYEDKEVMTSAIDVCLLSSLRV